MPKWRFLTNHALILMHVYEHPRSTLREAAHAVGITERAALSILRHLEEEALVSRAKEGRQNHYTVNVSAILKRPLFGPYTTEQLVRFITDLADRMRKGGGDGADGDG